MFIRKKYFIIISFIFFVILLKSSYASTVFVDIEFYKNNTASLSYFTFTKENYDNFFSNKGSGEYYVKILDKNENMLYSEKFGGMIFEIQKNTETGVITEEVDKISRNFRLLLPNNSYFIKFYKNQQKIFSISLADNICNGNHDCDTIIGESGYLCPGDCSCGNKKCESEFGETHESCPSDCPSQPISTPQYYNYIYIGSAVVIILLVIIFLLKIRRG